ncbi:hypothetical protein ACOMHN_012870 [Nucella lapillus]
MPTLHRSKSLNDKATRQKHRPGDVVRNPKSPEPAGRTRTRTCLDNYQLLVHLRKQTDDKSRQLELAYTYGSNTQTFLRPDAVQRVSEGRPLSELHPAPSRAAEPASRGHGLQRMSSAQSGAHCRQRSLDGCPGQTQRKVVTRQESFSEGQQAKFGQQQAPRCPRPMSMFEPGAGSPVPTVQDWGRKDKIIQNLMESQRCVSSHNQTLVGKIDELEAENARLKEFLAAYNIPHMAVPPALKLRSNRGGPLGGHEIIRSPSSDTFPKLTSTLISPISETSVSGYGSLTGSGYGEGHTEARRGCRRRVDTGVEEEAGGYNDDTLPLSEVSVERVGSEGSPLASPFSSGANSRVPTLNRSTDKAELDSLHEKLDQVLELERLRGSDRRKKRVTELEHLVLELTEQRNALLERYKHTVQENERLQTRDERIREELGSLLQQHGRSLQQALRSELQQLQQELQGLREDVGGQLAAVLTAVATCGGSGGRKMVTMDPQVRDVMDKVVDLIGPEYLRLGRQLNVPPLELERIENGQEDFAHKTWRLLQTWLRRRREEEKKKDEDEGGCPSIMRVPAVQVLTQALRDIDKDIRLFGHTPISTPERQALRKSLQCVIDHVTEPSDVIDHLITLNELTPAGITFVQEVLEESPGRALCRLWHVCEYRGSGIIFRLALVLERAGHPHVSRKLTDKLEIENARWLSHNYHPLHEDMDSSAASLAAQNLGSQPSPSNSGRSRPKSGWAKPSPADTVFEGVGLPVRPLAKSEKTTSLSLNPSAEDSDIVWDRQAPGNSNSPRKASRTSAAVPDPRTRVSRV